MKFVTLGDTHWGVNGNSGFWLNIVSNLFDGVINTCKEKGISEIVHLGDWFDSRKSINVKTINEVTKTCDKLLKNGIYVYVIVGNHDIYYKNSIYPTSLEILSNYENIDIIDTPYNLTNEITLSPWQTIPEEGNKYLFSHLEINGFPINYTGKEFEGGHINISDLSHFEQVYSGHFHTPSQKSNIKFIGSPYQMTFNDAGDSKGYYVFDNGKLEFIEFTNAPKFVRLTTEDELKEEEVKNNIVKFVFLEDYGNVKNDKLIEKVQSLQPHKLHIDYNINVDDSDLTQDGEDFQVDDNSKIIREYIDKKDLPKNIKKDVLKKFVEKLETEMGDL